MVDKIWTKNVLISDGRRLAEGKMGLYLAPDEWFRVVGELMDEGDLPEVQERILTGLEAKIKKLHPEVDNTECA